MKNRLLTFLLLILSAVGVSSQTNEAQKIDEFGSIQCEDYQARMDNVIVQAQNDPTSTFYILVYEGRESQYNERKKRYDSTLPIFGAAKAKISSMKKYISVVRKVSANNLQFTTAGFR